MDIVERLRKRYGFFLNGATWMMSANPDKDCHEAADEIERLRQELERVAEGWASQSTRAERAEAALAAANARNEEALEADRAMTRALARSEALEEAAKVCEARIVLDDEPDNFIVAKLNDEDRKCAAAIRALAAKEPTDT